MMSSTPRAPSPPSPERTRAPGPLAPLLAVSLPLLAPALLTAGACSGEGETGPADTSPAADSDSGAWPSEHAFSLSGEAPTNLIVISVDTLQVRRLGRYSGGDTSPFLDGLLAEGVALDNHRSCSNWTFASVICAMGGRDPMELGHVPTGTGTAPEPVPEGTRMFGSFLAERGYRSTLVTSNPFLSDSMHTAPGFDTVIEALSEDADALFARSLDEIDALEAAGGPWAFHVHAIDPHLPYAPPDAYLDGLEALEPVDYDLGDMNSVNAMRSEFAGLSPEERALIIAHMSVRYEGTIRYWDDELAAFFSALEARGALDDALVVLWSDHGEQVYERDGESIGHGISLYDLENRALAAYWAPGLAPVAWEGPTGHKDLLAGIWAVMGWEPEPEFTGLPAGAAADDRALFGITYQQAITLQSVIQGGDKLIYSWTGAAWLYDLAADPEEADDLSELRPDRVAELWALLEPEAQRLYEEFYPDGPAPIAP
jgi:arylsulfatase A-like enzyme